MGEQESGGTVQFMCTVCTANQNNTKDHRGQLTKERVNQTIERNAKDLS